MHAPRIFCIGRNYAGHVRELGGEPEGSEPRYERADDCLVFMKPASSLVAHGQSVTLPRERGSIHHELELVVEIGRAGANIRAVDATQHVGAMTLGIDLTLRDLQSRLKQAGAPWELCKAFDQSAPVGDRVPYRAGIDLQNIELSLRVNGGLRQKGNTADMLFPVARLIEILSASWRLLPGDLVFTGTPAGVGPLEPGDRVEVESPQIGRFHWDFC